MATTSLSIEPKPVPTRSPSELSSDADGDDEKLSTSTPSAANVNGTTTDVEAAGGTGKLARLTAYLARIGIETRSLERVQEDQREQLPLWRLAMRQIFFWFSVNLSFSALGTGMLGGLYFTLDFRTSMVIIWLGTALGVCVSATMALVGPKTGLRTMAASRFAGGWPGTAIFSLLNALTQLCYAVTTALSGAQALRAINNSLSLIVGIVILTVIVMVLAVWGYQFLHIWERWAWIACFVIYCIVLGLGARGGYDVTSRTSTMDNGRALTGDVLSFFGIMFSVGASWCSISADYNMALPATTPGWVIWGSAFVGMWFPIAFTCSVSATFMTLTKESYVTALEEESLGGVVGEILIQGAGGFGKFLLVLLAFSTISANIPNSYSGALCIQSLHPVLMKIPRVFFVVAFTLIYMVVAIAGREHFSEILSNFSAILAYYTAFLSAIVFLEIFYFRSSRGPLGASTNWDDVTDYSKLPPGYACVASICVTIPPVVMSMAETWYTGPIAKAVTEPASPYGGDLGFEMSAVVATVSYFIFRWIEIKVFKR